MHKKYVIIIFATVLSSMFTTLAYVMSQYATFWLSLEVITLPLIYAVGYEMLMDKQKKKYEQEIRTTRQYILELDKSKHKLEWENRILRRETAKMKKIIKVKNNH